MMHVLSNGTRSLGSGGKTFVAQESYPARTFGDIARNGLIGEYTPASMQPNGTWTNLVNGQIATTSGSPTYTASDPDFNNKSSLRFGFGHQLDGILFTNGTTDGMTVVSVVKMDTTTNGDGSMVWFLNDANNTPLDLWTGSPSHSRLVLNTFSGTQYGQIFSGDQVQLRMTTATIAYFSGGSNGHQLYQDGNALTMYNYSGAMNSINTSHFTFYPGAVPVSNNYSFVGRYSTLLIYNRILSASELMQTHSCLKNKYAIA